MEEGTGRDVDGVVIFLETWGIHDIWALSRVANLLDDVVNLVDGLLGRGFIHPLRRLELLRKFGFDVSDDGVAEYLGLGRESLLDEESAQDPAHAVVNMANALAPPFGCRVRVLCKMSVEQRIYGERKY